MLTAFGVVVLTFMMLMYALESRHSGFILVFALGCALSSAYEGADEFPGMRSPDV